MKNYDTIVGVGCSFMNGDAISDKDGVALTPLHKMRPAIFLSEKLNCNEVNLAATGSSNDGMFRRIYNWVEDNKNKKTLMIIGLSGTARYPIWNRWRNRWFEIHPAHINSYDDTALTKVNKDITNGLGEVNELRNWQKYYIKWIYNQEQEDSKLQRNVMMLHYYLKGNNIDYYIFNSLEDSLGDIKDKINYISFKKPEIDSWYRYLRYEMQEVDNNNFRESDKYRSPKPPYGRQFCNGHPSPRAQEKLAERIYKELDK
jgi:hypothetical protein|tara:strand:+ start:4618 stop:5391 length:774 start_codon:yes stop_codon:yes gene_type:complete